MMTEGSKNTNSGGGGGSGGVDTTTSTSNSKSTNQTVLEMTKKNERMLQEVPVIPVDCSFGIVRELNDQIKSLQESIRKERKAFGKNTNVTVAFAIRRPGCGACREHGQQLSYLLQKLPNVNAIGIIKETNVDNDALLEFYGKYYKYPMYKDDKWIIYSKILGNRKVSIWTMLWKFNEMNRRYKEKNIVNIPFGGDLFTQGGILIFDKEYKLRHIFYENYTQLYNLHELQMAITDAQKPLSVLEEEKLQQLKEQTKPMIVTKLNEDDASKTKEEIQCSDTPFCNVPTTSTTTSK